jgi:hypothetical protein
METNSWVIMNNTRALASWLKSRLCSDYTPVLGKTLRMGSLHSWQAFFKWLFLLSVAIMLVLSFYKDRLPEAQNYEVFDLPAPKQTATARQSFSLYSNEQKYVIHPKYDYELTGVVVSYNDANQLGNIWHHRRWKDFINVRDLCVLWGDNVKSGVYQRMHFSSDSWTCWAAWQESDANIFKGNALSNNHLLTDYNYVKKALLSSEVGDVIRFKGVLAAYEIPTSGFNRGTSTTRDDNGNGACETVYLDEFEIIKKANPLLRRSYILSKWLAIISFGFFTVLFLASPFRSKE